MPVLSDRPLVAQPLRTARAALVYHGFSINEAADAMLVSCSHLSKMLGGRVRANRRYMRQMSQWLGIRESELFPEVHGHHQGGDAA